ncbi:hypothetical protein F2Q69_00021026 [Brassica cretica]|uniref:Uncharacterized protein n=1 Tax=Brassica cretica TaxID=69181 RepID=A0A8S9QIS1_BRACR|nr:hypothetical protein F2Q69_00021026 [Brassica cretica]
MVSEIVSLVRFLKQFPEHRREKNLFRGKRSSGSRQSYHNCEGIRIAVKFLLKTQIIEGGWGEIYLACPNKEYTPLEGNRTNVVNTGQSMMSLIMAV